MTLPQEIWFMWTRKMTGPKILFLLNRYLWVPTSLIVVLFDQMEGCSNAVSAPVHVRV